MAQYYVQYILSLLEYSLMEASTAVRFFSCQKIGSDTDSCIIFFIVYPDSYYTS